MDSLSKLLAESELQFLGNACSDFQGQPIYKTAIGIPIISSDWEHMLFQNLKGNRKIKGLQKPSEFPKLHVRFLSYLKRSKELGENMFRISLDAARLSPKLGEFNNELMDQYILQLALIKYNGQEPMLTLYHWPMPLALCGLDTRGNINQGGWENDNANIWFTLYVTSVAIALSDKTRIARVLSRAGFAESFICKIIKDDLVKFVISINEPSTFTMNGYLGNIFPPYKSARFGLWNSVLKKISKAHKTAYETFHQMLPAVQIGVAYNWTYFTGAFGWLAQKYLFNERITKMFEENGQWSDFIGFQYYNRVSLFMPYPPIGPIKPKGRYYGDHPGFGDMYPKGLHWCLKKLHQMYPNKRIIVSEFGAVDAFDTKRPFIVMETVRQALLAKQEGVPLFGMLVWSLCNNFEWEQGMHGKCGLFNEADLERPLKPRDYLHTWQVWQAISRVLHNPCEKTKSVVDTLYTISKMQIDEACMRQ